MGIEQRYRAEAAGNKSQVQFLASKARHSAANVGSQDALERAGALALASIAMSRAKKTGLSEADARSKQRGSH
jgi:hypothetical protein